MNKVDFDLVAIAANLSDAKPANAEKILALAVDCDVSCKMNINWDLVKVAGELSENNRNAAIQLLMSAVTCEKGEKCCGGGGVQPDERVGVGEEKAVHYGKKLYTDENDPRDPNSRGFSTGGDGKYNAVNVLVKVQPETKYRCTNVRTLFSDESCQVFIHIYNKKGVEISCDMARLITGDGDAQIDKLYEAGNPNCSFSMGREAKYYPPSLGGCGGCVVNESGEIISDIVTSLGMPKGQHMSAYLVFQER